MAMPAKSSGSIDIRIRWERRAVKEVALLPKPDRKRVVAAIEGLRDNPAKGSILSAVSGASGSDRTALYTPTRAETC